MEMEYYSAGIQHSAETVKRFVRLQYDTFEWWRKLLLFLLSVAAILAGLALGSSVAAILALFVGCVILTNINSRADSVAEQTISAMHGSFPLLHYTFSEDGFTDGEDRPVIPYDRLFRLVEDEQYLYLFTGKATGYMLERGSVRGEEASGGLMQFLSAHSGLSWTKPFSLLTFRIRDVLPFRK